jgi:hypothetical protein
MLLAYYLDISYSIRVLSALAGSIYVNIQGESMIMSHIQYSVFDVRTSVVETPPFDDLIGILDFFVYS